VAAVGQADLLDPLGVVILAVGGREQRRGDSGDDQGDDRFA